MNFFNITLGDAMELPEVKQITEDEAKELRETMDKLQRLLYLDFLPSFVAAPNAPVYTTRLSNTTSTAQNPHT
jgi:hypothetical protein